jgi:hypothetical protein
MMKNIFIAAFLLLTNVQAEFIRDNTLEIVNDTTICMMWQDDVTSKTVLKKWAEAIDYCENLSFANYDDWRLPNFNELHSIFDTSKYNPSIKDTFINVETSIYWTSTTYALDTKMAWVLDFTGYSMTNNFNKELNYYVRCVRDGY